VLSEGANIIQYWIANSNNIAGYSEAGTNTVPAVPEQTGFINDYDFKSFLTTKIGTVLPNISVVASFCFLDSVRVEGAAGSKLILY
jgi:hypothetical protein